MTYDTPYRTATYDRAVAALQTLLNEEGPARGYYACGDAVAYLQPPYFKKREPTICEREEREERGYLGRPMTADGKGRKMADSRQNSPELAVWLSRGNRGLRRVKR